MKKFLFLLAFIFFSFYTNAQQLSDIKVSEFFDFVSIDRVFNILQVKYGVKINYDSTYCSTLKGYTHLYQQTDCDLVIKNVCRNNNLTFTIDDKGIINIASKSEEKKEGKKKEKAKSKNPD